MNTRTETDSLGPVEVPAHRYWGAQTQRSLENFPIGGHRMPRALLRALGMIKKTVATIHEELGLLDSPIADAIRRAADEVIDGTLDDHFPLVIWQTGSGTHTNMNVNEVVANRAIEILGGRLGSKRPVHANDHVNLGQSSNDTFSTAMHIAAAEELQSRLIPSLKHLHTILGEKASEFTDIVKVGRTHMMDAVPISLGQEFSGYAYQVARATEGIRMTLPDLYQLAQGGTAVGTGLNCHPELPTRFAAAIAEYTGLPFVTAQNKFAAVASHDALVATSGAMRTAAVALFKIANDVRLLGSGPRGGIGELILPANEPGSSIMPGKINPTQVEALAMVCVQVIGNDAAVVMAGMNGHLELNVFKPVIIHNLLESISLLADATGSFADRCVVGIEPDRQRITELLEQNLMSVTALSPVIGYDSAVRIAHKAHEERIGLREAALALGLLTGEEFDRYMRPERMIGPGDSSQG